MSLLSTSGDHPPGFGQHLAAPTSASHLASQRISNKDDSSDRMALDQSIGTNLTGSNSRSKLL
jgi:hypothetical protein